VIVPKGASVMGTATRSGERICFIAKGVRLSDGREGTVNSAPSCVPFAEASNGRQVALRMTPLSRPGGE
jgi:hypothetical protein